MAKSSADERGSAHEIAATIERDIRAGRLPAGARLPTVRARAEELGVAPGTVAAAYRELARRGAVVARGRAGTVVAPRPALGSARPAPLPPGVVDLRSGNPDPGLLPRVRRPAGGSAFYGSPQLELGLEAAGREWLAGNGVDAEHLAVVGGAMEGVERVLQAHLAPGDAVAVEDPGYPNVVGIARLLGLAPVPVALDGAGMEVDALAAVLRSVAAVVLTPRAQNPTGAAFTAGRARLLGELLDQHPDVLVIEDDHNGDVAGAPLRSVATGRSRWAVVHSVAKSFGPDWRLALVAGDESTVDRVQVRQRLGAGWVSHQLQRPIGAALADPATRARLQAAAARYAERREALLAALADRGVPAVGASGFNVWVPVADEAAVVSGMQALGWGVQGGARFRLGSPPAVRVTASRLDPRQAPEVAAALASVTDGAWTGA